VRRTLEHNGKKHTGLVETTVGTIIFNEAIPQDLGLVDRKKEENILKYEVDFLCGKKEIGKIIERCILKHGNTKTAYVLDKIKALGFSYSTKGAITIGVTDMIIPDVKQRYLDETESKIEVITNQYKRGLISEDERYEAVIREWNKTGDDLTKALMDNLSETNPIFMMSDSGARGNISQIKQLAGMRGLMSDTQGKTIEIPIRSNFREGLNVLEFFLSAHGARKGLADTALRTADSGYLTRRLVDVSQDVIIKEINCRSEEGIVVKCIKDGKDVIEPLSERVVGRYSLEDVTDPVTGESVLKKGDLIKLDTALILDDIGIQKLHVRSVLGCRCRYGVCAHCYGLNLATGEESTVGEAVGIIAAQSIGEPGTQLTMRTFHTGGVAGEDITSGLPRVEEIFEVRKPKGLAIISEISGTVMMHETKKKKEIIINGKDGESKNYLIPYGSRLKVQDGEEVVPGDELTEGSVYPQDILRIKGIQGVQSYLIQEVQKVYRLQGVDINDRHIEVIIRQMMKKIKITEQGETDLLPNSLIDIFDFQRACDEARRDDRIPPEGTRALLGITKASLATDSFLSAASFQETTRVLTDAAIKGKVDPLIGLKENVIIGKLIPAGTGIDKLRRLEVTYTVEEEPEEDFEISQAEVD
jgi:DNA-directed RNA polymerase subunit beta'